MMETILVVGFIFELVFVLYPLSVCWMFICFLLCDMSIEWQFTLSRSRSSMSDSPNNVASLPVNSSNLHIIVLFLCFDLHIS